MEFEFLEDEQCIGRVVRDRTAVFDRSDQWLLKRYRMPRVVLLELCHELEPVLGVPERGADLPVSIRLAAALRVYAEGYFQRASGDLAGISQPSVSRAVAQVSAAIITKKLDHHHQETERFTLRTLQRRLQRDAAWSHGGTSRDRSGRR